MIHSNLFQEQSVEPVLKSIFRSYVPVPEIARPSNIVWHGTSGPSRTSCIRDKYRFLAMCNMYRVAAIHSHFARSKTAEYSDSDEFSDIDGQELLKSA